MATTKNPTKKPAAKRAPAKSSARTTVRRATNPLSNMKDMRSFHSARSTEPFLTFRITHQTVYWAVLAILVLLLGLWVININDRVQQIYDQVDALNASTMSTSDAPVRTPLKTPPATQP